MSAGTTPRARLSPFLRGSLALHAAAVPAAVLAPSAWPWIVATLVADHTALVSAGLLPRSRWLGPNLSRDAAAAAAGAVALTFDDGPDPAVTPRILEILDAHRARASFFCIGDRVAARPDLAAEIARRGHHVENHTYSHRTGFFFHGPARLESEIARAQEVVQRATGRAPAYFRAPAGIRGPLLESALSRHGLALASWTRRGFDTVARDPVSVLGRLERDLAAGDILVLHDRSRGGGPELVVEVLPRLLETIASRGFAARPLGSP
jgi:peptidoglycan/xylan/chitin deacetylase (PgdA/CDA1 family)